MARPRSLPENNSELEGLLRRHTMTEVADMYGVSVQAVSAAVRSRNLTAETRVNLKEYIPWRVKVEHSEHYLRRMLRLYAYEQIGRELNHKQAGELARFKRKMDEVGGVVQYDPEHEKGPWLVVPRRPGVDKGYVRNPEVP